ncbi:MAG: SurA N-terminal domain-containing protein [Kiritimatiellia bacterium]
MRFHKLIQSRLLWLIFLGVLITTFVGWGVATNQGDTQQTERLKRTVATVDGEDISFLRLDVTRRLIANQARQSIPEEQLTEMALNHLAMVAYAEKAGLKVPTEMARQQFAAIFAGEDGKIDEAALENFRQGLRGSFLTETDYIRFIQEGITLENLQRMIASYVLVPGFDVDRWATSQTDSYTVEFAALTPEILENEVEVSEEQLQSFFAENQARFQIPEKRKVNYLIVNPEDFTDQVPEITSEAALDYYMQRPELYVRSVVKPATEEGGTGSSVQEPIPFDEVKDQIIENLRKEQARKLAEETAMSYAVRMTPRRGRPGKSLESIREESGVALLSPPPFSMREPVEGLANSFGFKQAVFKLDESDLGKRGGPVEAGNGFALMELVEIIPSRPAALEEVRADVESAARDFYTREAVKVKAGEVVESIRSQVADGTSFEEALKSYSLNMVSPPPFELRNLNPNQPMLPPELLESVSSAVPGEVLGPVESRFGVSFVARLVDRSPNPEQAAELSPQVRNMLSAQLHFPEVFARFRKLSIEPMIQRVEPGAGQE